MFQFQACILNGMVKSMNSGKPSHLYKENSYLNSEQCFRGHTLFRERGGQREIRFIFIENQNMNNVDINVVYHFVVEWLSLGSYLQHRQEFEAIM